ncbi:hypothetical protein [Synechococcus sp. A15-28]|uniref:hypothetical protein n=1 Tax=Synechococcus sp. A15-28 TaxID=1050638 RepID=UPI0016489C6A|nr:hypothetical protein [Synechococcus sp. A15-28]QNI42280.1 hypothetical protein SynA1528_01248 [Synechococcus sp. A15-28]
MGTAPQALLLSTIATDANDWHIGRFSLLGTMIRTAGEEMDPSFNLTISDYPTSDAERKLLQDNLSSGRYGQIWLIAPDLDNGPDAGFFRALEAAVKGGTDLVIARDHTDLGCCLLELKDCLDDVGQTQTFQRTWTDLPKDREYADPACAAIVTPCVVTGQNGGVQICRQRAEHPLLNFASMIPGHLVIPAHPHEGVIRKVAASQTVLLSSFSITSGREQTTAIVDEAEGRGMVLHHSTFHHFADYNLDVAKGAPDFVLDPPSTQTAESPALLNDIKDYVRSVVRYAQTN